MSSTVQRLWQLWLKSTGSVVAVNGLSCSAACGIFWDQGSKPCLLDWQADSLPLNHQGSPDVDHFKVFIEFATTWLLFYVLIFQLRGIWYLSSPTRHWTCAPCIGRWSLTHWTDYQASPGASIFDNGFNPSNGETRLWKNPSELDWNLP